MFDAARNDSDGAVIAAVLEGETERFAVLVRRYEAPLLRVARNRLGRDDWAEDAVQETFLCAFKSLRSYDSTYSFRTWLWTILLNQCRRRYQREARSLPVAVLPAAGAGEAADPSKAAGEPALPHRSRGDGGDARIAELRSPGESPPERLLAKERSEQLARLLERLPDAQADALRLRFFGELTYPEIARSLGCSVSTAKNRVRWGLETMSAWLHPNEAVPEGRNEPPPDQRACCGDLP